MVLSYRSLLFHWSVLFQRSLLSQWYCLIGPYYLTDRYSFSGHLLSQWSLPVSQLMGRDGDSTELEVFLHDGEVVVVVAGGAEVSQTWC